MNFLSLLNGVQQVHITILVVLLRLMVLEVILGLKQAFKTFFVALAYKTIINGRNLDKDSILVQKTKSSRALYQKRSPNFFSQLFFFFSSTEKMFKEVKNELEKERVVEVDKSKFPKA
ncbi:hypothetical protein [Legionella hackeliae]|uniref:Uncharacterized protein n=1 Tax=Legionella hackeliae TaxID=449 RepID=A0A0A8UU08_LEGHA|nr:hypothetical protein [Legionella hackeliae]KTD13866.1 hypothetical protein Lhac_0710 [Legionella hackeliae]CEK10567.1 protein of unknown function [Legionella hackeliae]STX47307.1 Uncharacterised protein [Legionella hackeliae]